MELAKWLGRILNITDETFEISELSIVTDLPTALAVERRLVEEHIHSLPDLGGVDARPIPDDGQHHTFAFVARVARELGRTIFLGEVEPDVLVRLCARTLPCSTGR